jgi:hypothetical protein
MIRRPAISFLLVSIAVILPGCVRRTIEISSDPPGALVFLNDREVGRTPIEVDFVYYGTYDVRLLKDGYEALLTSGDAKPPWWDNLPLDLVAEAVPGEPHAQVKWHYTLQPEDSDAARLTDRAREMRATIPDLKQQAAEPETPAPVDEES